MKTKRLMIRCDEDTFTRFQALQAVRGPDAGSCLSWMLDVSEQMHERRMHSAQRSADLAKVSDATRAQWEDRDVSDPRQRRGKLPGISFVHCRNVLDRLMAANQAQADIEHRRYISRSLLEEEAGVSPVITKRFCDANAEEIRAHNVAMGFADAREGQKHNQWRYKPTSDTNGVPST
jgi:hypothetical protein